MAPGTEDPKAASSAAALLAAAFYAVGLDLRFDLFWGQGCNPRGLHRLVRGQKLIEGVASQGVSEEFPDCFRVQEPGCLRLAGKAIGQLQFYFQSGHGNSPRRSITHDIGRGAQGQRWLPWPGSHLRIIMGSDSVFFSRPG